MDIKILVAAHKPFRVPADEIYLPLHVGAEGKLGPDGKPLDFGYIKDNTGDNISGLNPYFCELTGLYWAWKNLDCDYLGLVQYRRFFKKKHSFKGYLADIAVGRKDLEPMLGSVSVFVPKKRRYYIETIYSHYEHTHDERHLELCRKIIKEKSPEYSGPYEKVLKRRWGYMFNMMIMRSDLIDAYCSWLFDILFTLFDEVDHQNMSDFDKRYPGRVAEVLFNVWLEYMLETGRLKKSEVKELPFVEDVVWNQKIRYFLAAKFLGRKYESSAQSRGRTEG